MLLSGDCFYNVRLEARGMLPLLVIIYSYNFVQRDLPLSLAANKARRSARKRERERERDHVLPHTRLSMFAGVDTHLLMQII